MRIVSPAAGHTHHDNRGELPVQLECRVAAARLKVLLDGEMHGPVQRESTFTLHEVHRGGHTLQVQVLDGGGNVIAQSEPITFYMWQASRLFPGR